jgi:hypothetical protein
VTDWLSARWLGGSRSSEPGARYRIAAVALS